MKLEICHTPNSPQKHFEMQEQHLKNKEQHLELQEQHLKKREKLDDLQELHFKKREQHGHKVGKFGLLDEKL
jgi:hypothetical protein